jgi:hypothetical protein
MAKKAKRKAWMKLYDLRLNDEDISHLRWLLQNEAEWQQHLMDSPPTKGQTPDEKLEDWVVARDMKTYAMRIVQMIDKVYKGGKK